MQGILVDRLASALWPEYLDNMSVVLSLLDQLDVIVRQSARLSCSVSGFSVFFAHILFFKSLILLC